MLRVGLGRLVVELLRVQVDVLFSFERPLVVGVEDSEMMNSILGCKFLFPHHKHLQQHYVRQDECMKYT